MLGASHGGEFAGAAQAKACEAEFANWDDWSEGVFSGLIAGDGAGRRPAALEHFSRSKLQQVYQSYTCRKK